MRRIVSVPSLALLASISGLTVSEVEAAPPPDDLTDHVRVDPGVVNVRINEIRIDETPSNSDPNEYFELVGIPGTPLDGLTYIVIGDAPTGVIEVVVSLNGQVMPADGTFVVAEGTFTLGVADFTTLINFENQDVVTHMLVTGFTGAVSTNIDIDGNDYWVWQAIERVRPKVVVVEYNPYYEPPRRWVMTYDPAHAWDGSTYYGASLESLARLGRAKGYELLCCDRQGNNAFFVEAPLLARFGVAPVLTAMAAAAGC